MIWRLIAWLVTRPRVRAWLLYRAERNPYSEIRSKDGRELYMWRGWVFNPYPAPGEYRRKGWRDWLPSVRVHHILRPDSDRHLHDHPWNARTIVLGGWYKEVRLCENPTPGVWRVAGRLAGHNDDGRWLEEFHRPEGYTGRLLYGQYHRISEVSPGGVFTLFFTWRYRGTWGFLVNGHKVPWKEYGNEQ